MKLSLNQCLVCGAPITGGALWTVEGKHGVPCKPCEAKLKVQLLAEYDKHFAEWGLPSTTELLADFRIGKKGFPRIGSNSRWVVRCAPLRGGKCWTVAALQTKEQACTFASFWGSHCYTEVRVIELKRGQRCDAEILDNFESMLRSRVPRPPFRPSLPPLRRMYRLH